MAANSEKMGQLHELLAQIMIDELKWYTEQDPPLPVPAADKAAVAKFLKDNAITCDPADADSIARLKEEFEASRQASRSNALRAVRNTEAELEELYGKPAVG